MKNESDEQLCLNMDLMNCGSKVVGYRNFPLCKYIWNEWHTIVMTGERIKPPKDIKYVSVECTAFIKSPRKMKCCLVIIYILVHFSECGKKRKIQCSNGNF